ncbi:hypothetical protein EXIGLDRAFT_671918 [Exidia glandulosa HHB12029]|uniref:Small secreted protein n=1 Tax=Exidia glandulosa HHB12029 TaxID=1314781 RepID=A0A165K1G4_EXIGL|nr:hypothetical protein EXIGLDRAFT_671918 [Exidia glandulosa HHB12029]
MRVLFAVLLAAAAIVNAQTLNMTSITGRHGKSVFECWAFGPFATSGQQGTVGALSLQLGNLANASFSILPPRFDAGQHNAPNVQYVQFLSGVAHVTLPSSNETVFVIGGSKGLIFAADTIAVSGTGHLTAYPSDEPTRVLQIPTLNGVVPKHTVLHSGPCTGSELQ